MSILDNHYPQIDVPPDFGVIPDESECVRLWDKYGMLRNIREHSYLVAGFARAIALIANERMCAKGLTPEQYINVEAVYVAGLLHDIAKTWTIRNGGSHQQIGASILRAETGSPLLAACVFHHVMWPWQEGALSIENKIYHIPLLIAYADKRVKHNKQVTLEERFADLLERYGKTDAIRANIKLNLEQARRIEKALADKMEFNIYACTLVSGCLVV